MHETSLTSVSSTHNSQQSISKFAIATTDLFAMQNLFPFMCTNLFVIRAELITESCV